MGRSPLHVLDLRRAGVGIFDQLVIEEALLRADRRNWCIINSGHAQSAIVMGISGQAHKLIDMSAAIGSQMPVIRRFTGGGTVVVDSNTLFVTFICNQADVAGRPLYPRDLMRWSEGVYAPALRRLIPGQKFALNEHDYCLGSKKVGGNAQSVSRDRWVHHTSWLWSFSHASMALLTLPDKRPAYREDRRHGDFLTTLQEHCIQSEPGQFLEGIVDHVCSTWPGWTEPGSTDAHPGQHVRASLADVQEALVLNERKSNKYVDLIETLKQQSMVQMH